MDETRTFKRTTLVCLMVATACVTSLGLAEGFDQHFPNFVVVGVLLLLGGLIGPVQPINAELAVEVAYPADENAIEATQQLSGKSRVGVIGPSVPVLGRRGRDVRPLGRAARAFGLVQGRRRLRWAVTAAGRPTSRR